MNRAIGTHRLKPVIDRVYPLAQSAEAFRQLESGAQFGKIVIDVAGAGA
jgi:NADPH:quinone reductase-like Zn-dependent oxidoreductase